MKTWIARYYRHLSRLSANATYAEAQAAWEKRYRRAWRYRYAASGY